MNPAENFYPEIPEPNFCWGKVGKGRASQREMKIRKSKTWEAEFATPNFFRGWWKSRVSSTDNHACCDGFLTASVKKPPTKSHVELVNPMKKWWATTS
jgi:hypothetical protein